MRKIPQTKSFLFLAGEAHLALLSAQWGIGMREKGAKNGLLIVKQPAVPPNPIGSGGHIRRQERSICSDWSAGGNVALPPFAITDTFHIFSGSFNMSSGKCYFEYLFGFFLWFAAFISEFTWTHRVLEYETLLGFQKIVPCYVASYLYIFNRGQKSDIVCSPQRYEMQMYRLHYLKR